MGDPISPAPAASDGGQYAFAIVDRPLSRAAPTYRGNLRPRVAAPARRRRAHVGRAVPFEIGAGAGCHRTLACRAGRRSGEVVAVDLDASFLRAALANKSGVRVVEGHAREVLEPSRFDLVHARYVLVHNADWEALLDATVSSLKPGAALVLEEPNFTVAKAASGADAEAFERVNDAICTMFRAAAKDPLLGLRLPAAVEQRGLRVERAENAAPLCRGGEPIAAMMAMSTRQLRDKYLATGVVDENDLDGYLRFAADPASWGIYYATVSVLARKVRSGGGPIDDET